MTHLISLSGCFAKTIAYPCYTDEMSLMDKLRERERERERERAKTFQESLTL